MSLHYATLIAIQIKKTHFLNLNNRFVKQTIAFLYLILLQYLILSFQIETYQMNMGVF